MPKRKRHQRGQDVRRSNRTPQGALDKLKEKGLVPEDTELSGLAAEVERLVSEHGGEVPPGLQDRQWERIKLAVREQG